jgi:hypothetical protein
MKGMFVNGPNNNNLIAYHGPISLSLTSFVGNYMKDVVPADQQVVTRIFKVFVELVQNVSNYSAQVNNKLLDVHKHRNGIGWFSIDDNNNVFQISTGNMIAKEHGPILSKNCDQINALNEEALRDLKRKTRMQSNIRDVGAHIGLIHTGILTSNPLVVEISPVDDKYSFFKITAKVNKTINN